MARREMTEGERLLAEETYAAIQEATNSTERSKQQQEFRLGVSNLGHCHEYARRMVLQIPPSDVVDKTPAFLGTIVGDAVEAALARRHPNWLFQTTLKFRIPSGGEMLGHSDIIIPFDAATPEFPQGVVDVKTRAELESIRRYGASKQQQFQKAAYCAAAIDAGYLDPGQPIYVSNLWVDRSGMEVMPYVITEPYDENLILEIDQWIEDVKYAALHGEEASKDPSREFCWAYCEYATDCRGNDTDAEGIIQNPEAIAAVEAYLEGRDMEAAGKRLKQQAMLPLRGVNGSTGTHTVRWVATNASSYMVHRDPGLRLDIKPVGGRKK